ncbi:hypothetical protein EVAR_50404_1 [Eumeta japonica]|uniref:Uncharacterized protein n=1 Tax=Eumeta variegata TaxID=151549 RepID=A0A4C1WVP8_EUMVA|nr:hypothetical protein EVAR_50404_1 [Eumeta japonica]
MCFKLIQVKRIDLRLGRRYRADDVSRRRPAIAARRQRRAARTAQALRERAHYVKCLGDHGTAACTRNKDTDGSPACVLCKLSAALRRAPARAVRQNLSYAKATAGPRKDPPTNSAPSTSPSEDIKALMLVISIVDIGEIVLLANKFKAAANPVEKILILAEHAPLVEAIKNNKI